MTKMMMVVKALKITVRRMMTSDDDDDIQDLPTSRAKQGLSNHIATSSGGHYND